jgi:hypothetical protein
MLKKLWTVALAQLCFVSFAAIWCARRDENKTTPLLLFEAIPVKDTVEWGYPVFFKFRLENKGKAAVLASSHFYVGDTVLLDIKSSSGEKAVWCGHIDDVAASPGDFVKLAPGGLVESTLRISCNPKKTRGYSFPRPGEYVVKARYELPFPETFLKKVAGSALVTKEPIEAGPVHLKILSTPNK